MSKIPGVVWSGLLVALPLIAVWLGDSFPAAQWAAPVAGLLLILAKVVEVIRAGSAPVQMPGEFAGEMLPPSVQPKPSLWWG